MGRACTPLAAPVLNVLVVPRVYGRHVLEQRGLLEAPGLRLASVRCRGERAWSPEEHVTGASVVLVRSGVFLRRVEGTVAVADVTTGYLQRRGECQQVAHPAGGDVCTSIAVPDDLADRFAHAGPVVVSTAADLAHRRLIAQARATAAVACDSGRVGTGGDAGRVGAGRVGTGGDAGRVGASRVGTGGDAGRVGPDSGGVGFGGDASGVGPDSGGVGFGGGVARVDVVDLAVALIDSLLPTSQARPVSAATCRAVDEVRAAIHADPALGLDDLAALAGWSPWYLSRTFRRVTGATVSAYRRTLRVRAALDQLADARDGLAALALRIGFADQAHLTRAMRREIDMPPAAARRWLLGEPR
jgi:AraC-like DNA-binding protein